MTSAAFSATDPAPAAAPPPASAKPSEAEKVDDEILPVLSPRGIKRQEENRAIVEQNVADLEENVTICGKNVKTLQNELKDLTDLEREHEALRDRYRDYLVRAEKENAKNEAALRKSQIFEKDARGAADHMELEKARLDIGDRTRWRGDAAGKVKRINELLKGLKDNFGNIQTRRYSLQKQLKCWVERKKDFEKQLAYNKDRKATFDKIAKKP